MIITVAQILKFILLIVPSVLASVTTIVGAINGAFNVQNPTVKHVISWVVPILLGVLSVATGVASLGFGWVDYLVGAVCGAIAGCASNGIYDWEVIENLIDKFYYLFGHGATIDRKRARKAAARLAQ